MVTIEAARRETRDGRGWILRAARPTDARAIAALFAEVRREGRYLITPPTAASDPSEAFFLGELIRADRNLVMVAESAGQVVGNVLVTVESSVISGHVGTLAICIDRDWRDVGIGSLLVAAAQNWAAERGLRKVALGVFPDNGRAIAVYEHAGFVREGLRRMQYRSGDEYRDELLMAWFPQEDDR